MTEWTPKAGKDAVVRVTGHMTTTDGQKHAYIGGIRTTVPFSSLRPLPPAQPAEDAAVLAAADKWAGDFIREGGARDFMSTEAQNLISAVERRRSTPPAAVAQDSAWQPKAGDRVRTKWVRDISGEPIRGVVTYIGASGDVIYKIDNGGGVGSALPSWLEPDPEPATPRDTTALRDAVVGDSVHHNIADLERAVGRAAVAEHIAYAAYSKSGDGVYSELFAAFDAASQKRRDAVRALLAAEAPADPVAELREAAAGVLGMWGQPECAEIARLRAALSALGDRGRR